MTGRIVVVGCGRDKAGEPRPAAELYRGSYFRSCLAAALAIAPRDRVLILSALHGLVGLDETLAPYDMSPGFPGSVTAVELGRQAVERGIEREPVLALCPGRYADLLRAVFADVSAPLSGLGIGEQRGALARLRRGEAA